MMPLHITPVFVAIFLIFAIAIALPIGPLRGRLQIRFWGSDEALDRLLRGHGNLIEYVPLALLGMAVAELTGAHETFLLGSGIILLIARIAHYVGLQKNASSARLVGTLTTLLLAPSLAGSILWPVML